MIKGSIKDVAKIFDGCKIKDEAFKQGLAEAKRYGFLVLYADKDMNGDARVHAGGYSEGSVWACYLSDRIYLLNGKLLNFSQQLEDKDGDTDWEEFEDMLEYHNLRILLKRVTLQSTVNKVSYFGIDIPRETFRVVGKDGKCNHIGAIIDIEYLTSWGELLYPE